MGDKSPVLSPTEARSRELEEHNSDLLAGIATVSLDLHEAESCSDGTGPCPSCIRRARHRLDALLPDDPDPPAENELAATGVHHLWCQGCDDQPNYALIDGAGVLVCHCTHVDGEIDPVEVHGFDGFPDRWQYRRPKAWSDSEGESDE